MKPATISATLKFVVRRPEGWSFWTLFAVTSRKVWIHRNCFDTRRRMYSAAADSVRVFLDNEDLGSEWQLVWSADRAHVQGLMNKAEQIILEEELDKLPM